MARGAQTPGTVVHHQKVLISVFMAVMAGCALDLPGGIEVHLRGQAAGISKLPIPDRQSQVVDKRDGMVIRKIRSQGEASP
jgi:hypothetical protein